MRMALSTLPQDQLHALARRADALDRSWSLAADGRVEERVLFFFSAGARNASLLADAAAVLGLAEPVILRWQDALPGADAIGLAINARLSSIRLYAQYWEETRAQVAAGNLAPVILYRGFKSLPGGILRDDAYICHPMMPRAAFWPPILRQMHRFGLDPNRAEAAFAGLEAQSCILTRTHAPGRDSWLATVRRAPPDRAALADLLSVLPDEGWSRALRAQAGCRDLLHVAGGTDRLKGEFLSFYFAAEPDDVTGLLLRGTA